MLYPWPYNFVKYFIDKIVTHKEINEEDGAAKDCQSDIYLLIFIFLTFVSLILFLLFIFLFHLPLVSIIFLLLFFGLLLVLLFSNSAPWSWFSFNKVLLYAVFTKLPIEVNSTLPIRSIPPTDYQIQLKESTTQIHIENGSAIEGSQQTQEKSNSEKESEKKKR